MSILTYVCTITCSYVILQCRMSTTEILVQRKEENLCFSDTSMLYTREDEMIDSSLIHTQACFFMEQEKSEKQTWA